MEKYYFNGSGARNDMQNGRIHLWRGRIAALAFGLALTVVLTVGSEFGVRLFSPDWKIDSDNNAISTLHEYSIHTSTTFP